MNKTIYHINGELDGYDFSMKVAAKTGNKAMKIAEKTIQGYYTIEADPLSGEESNKLVNKRGFQADKAMDILEVYSDRVIDRPNYLQKKILKSLLKDLNEAIKQMEIIGQKVKVYKDSYKNEKKRINS